MLMIFFSHLPSSLQTIWTALQQKIIQNLPIQTLRTHQTQRIESLAHNRTKRDLNHCNCPPGRLRCLIMPSLFPVQDLNFIDYRLFNERMNVPWTMFNMHATFFISPLINPVQAVA